MSRSVDLFISSEASLEEVAATIAARSDLRPEASASDGRLTLTDGVLFASLHEHQFVEDGDIALRRYRYALSLRTTASGHLGLTSETALLRRVATTLDDHPVLLVLDLQYRDGLADGRPR